MWSSFLPAIGFFLAACFLAALSWALKVPPSKDFQRPLGSGSETPEREHRENISRADRFFQFWKVCAQVALIISLAGFYFSNEPAIPRPLGYLFIFLGASICLVVSERAGRFLGRRLSVILSRRLLRSSLWSGRFGRLSEDICGLIAPSEFPAETSNRSGLDRVSLALASARKEGLISEEVMRTVEAILALEETEVVELMAPRIEKVTLKGSMTIEEALVVLAGWEERFIPVFEEKPENVAGIIYLEDLLRQSEKRTRKIRELMHKPYFVPETKRVTELLRDFKRERIRAALVLDEHGDVSGMISLDEIADFAFALAGGGPSEVELRLLGEGIAEVEGTVRVNEVSEALGVQIPPSEDYETIAGYLLSRLERIPKRGEEFEYDGIRFKVIDAEPRRITRLRLEVRRRRK